MNKLKSIIPALLAIAFSMSMPNMYVNGADMEADMEADRQNNTIQSELQNTTILNDDNISTKPDDVTSNSTHGCYPLCTEEAPTFK